MVVSVMDGASGNDVLSAEMLLTAQLSLLDQAPVMTPKSLAEHLNPLGHYEQPDDGLHVVADLDAGEQGQLRVELHPPAPAAYDVLAHLSSSSWSRALMRGWLDELARHDSVELRQRAALAMGSVAARTQQFDTLRGLIVDWAGSDALRERQAASIAIDAMTWNESAAVAPTMRRWAKGGNGSRRWTALVASSGLFGIRHTTDALSCVRSALLAVGEPMPIFVTILGQLAAVRETEAETLASLVRWSAESSSRAERRLAVEVVGRVLERKRVGPQARPWIVEVAYMPCDSHRRRDAVVLLARTLRHATTTRSLGHALDALNRHPEVSHRVGLMAELAAAAEREGIVDAARLVQRVDAESTARTERASASATKRGVLR
jgi:2-oxo-4-hydroxy-4-carboxy--5-ureidoimidazoline (OHCU) decarboxylase